MYTDLCLKFPDEATAKSVLYRMEGVVAADLENGIEAQEGYEVANYANIDTIGTIYERTGGTDEEPVMTALDGWHVNVLVLPGEDASVLEAHQVFPATPVRVWG